MLGADRLLRIGTLLALVVLLVAGRATGRLDRVLAEWEELRLGTRVAITVFVGWPYAAYVSPVLLDFWTVIVANTVGVGSRYVVRNTQTALLLLLTVAVLVQTTVTVVKVKSVEEAVGV